MKSIIFFLLIGFFFKAPGNQFNGVLRYESDYNMGGSSGKVLTTIYQADSKGRIESTNVNTKSPLGPPTTRDQDVLIYDFATQQETHLQALTNRAIVTQYDALLMQQQKMMEQMGTTVSVENAGDEKVGDYNCTHFVMTTVNPKIKSTKLNSGRKDIWITGDLGSCHLWYVGPYLYYPKGTFLQKKLADAGADGVVVKWQSGSGAMQTSGILISYENKRVPSSTFTPPSGYIVVKPDLSQKPQKN
jgi:Domain of unknown function (DUF4412)